MCLNDPLGKSDKPGPQLRGEKTQGISGTQDEIASGFLKESYSPKFGGGLIHIFLPKKVKMGLA